MKINEEKIQKNSAIVAKLMKSLAHKERLQILCHLLQGEFCVGELLERSALSSSALSQHLAKFRLQELVKTRKEAQTVYYRLADKRLIKLFEMLYELYCK